MRRSFWLPAVMLLPLLLVGAKGGSAPSAPASGDAALRDAASDDALKFVPGLWQVTTVSKFPLVDQTTTETEMHCLSGSPISPELLAANHRSCKIDREVNGNTETWEMRCNAEPGDLEGSGSFRSFGDSARGWMKTKMTVGDQVLLTELRWDGQRLGECGMELPKKRAKRRRSKKDERPTLTPEEREERRASFTPEEREERRERRQKAREEAAKESEAATSSNGS